MARIAVCGYMIRYPLAGMVLAYFHYLLGLHRLGHQVFYCEESGWPGSCYNPTTDTSGDDPTFGLQNLKTLMQRFGLDFPVCYIERETGRIHGLERQELKRMLGESDLLLNIGGVCWLSEFRLCRRRALIDMDPFFTQIGHMGLEGFDEYHTYFSYGTNIGREGCTIPTNGIHWVPTFPPVVPEIWSRQQSEETIDDQPRDVFTTVANWKAYGEATYNGEMYGQKDKEFVRFLMLPRRVVQKLELALSGAGPDTIEQLSRAGWLPINSGDISSDISSYLNYIIRSRGEFSVAKNAYVKTRSGWFSDRSVCYLAAGLPVILQDTGFTDRLTGGKGILFFSSIDEAADCIHNVNANYAEHRAMAARIAREVFSYKVVLPRIIEAGCA